MIRTLLESESNEKMFEAHHEQCIYLLYLLH